MRYSTSSADGPSGVSREYISIMYRIGTSPDPIVHAKVCTSIIPSTQCRAPRARRGIRTETHAVDARKIPGPTTKMGKSPGAIRNGRRGFPITVFSVEATATLLRRRCRFPCLHVLRSDVLDVGRDRPFVTERIGKD